MNEWFERDKCHFNQDASQISNWIVTLEAECRKKKEIYFRSTRTQSTNRFRRSAEHIRTCCTCIIVSITNEIDPSNDPPPPPSLLSSIVPHSDRHKVSSFVFVAESCELNPFPLSLPVRPLTTRMTDDERRRLIRIDVDIWIADTRILRHGTRFKPSSTRPGHPLREIRTLDSLARRGVKTREETRRRHKRRNGIERFLHIARLDGLPRAKPSFERHSSLEEREGRKGEWFTSGNIGRDGKKPWKRIEKLDEFSTRFCSTTATSRCGL